MTAIGFTKDSVLAGDAADRAIRRFDRSGKFLNNIGKDNPVNGLLIPNGVVDFAVDAQGIIYAANPGKHRVERYTAGGELLGHIGRFDGSIRPGSPAAAIRPTWPSATASTPRKRPARESRPTISAGNCWR